MVTLNLDNVNIAGVSTHNEGIFLPDGKIAKFEYISRSDLEYIMGNKSVLSKIALGDCI